MENLAPIKEVIRIIDSCTNKEQLKTCERLKNVYARLAQSKGVINPEAIRKTLNRKIKERRIELEYIEEFV